MLNIKTKEFSSCTSFNPRHRSAPINYENYSIVIEDPYQDLNEIIAAETPSHFCSHGQIQTRTMREYYCTCENGARTVDYCNNNDSLVSRM